MSLPSASLLLTTLVALQWMHSHLLQVVFKEEPSSLVRFFFGAWC